MIEVLNQKTLVVTPPAAIVDNAAVTTASVDAIDAGWVTFEIIFGAMDIAVSALKLREADDDSTYSDVPLADFSVDGTLPSATADNTIVAVQVNMLGRKRYLDLSFTAGDGSAGTYSVVLARLSRMATTPSTAADRGYAQELFA
jgi:hypothetical protein